MCTKADMKQKFTALVQALAVPWATDLIDHRDEDDVFEDMIAFCLSQGDRHGPMAGPRHRRARRGVIEADHGP